ncbi:MAG: hypothetical protein R3212_07450, partial [Xanthomonadales bacterium]|nr:hypothetical protein [Xanthomonadales bacterium]
MTEYSKRSGLQVHHDLLAFVESELLPDLEIDADAFWSGFAGIVNDLTPRNRALLERRDELQAQIDEYHRQSPGQPSLADYRAFLERIGYLEPGGQPFTISTENVDPEIASIAGPQLVV